MRCFWEGGSTWPSSDSSFRSRNTLGRLDEARETIARLRTITPVLAPPGKLFRNPEHHELFLFGLRTAMCEAD
jgi:hypothetical protein